MTENQIHTPWSQNCNANALRERESLPVKNVLIIDSDLGFVFWLGQTLDAAGYETLPAKGVPEAISLLSKFRIVIDVLIAQAKQDGVDAFAVELRRAQGGNLKTIGLSDDVDEPGASLSSWDAWQVKPHLPDQTAKETFLALIQNVLELGTALRGI